MILNLATLNDKYRCAFTVETDWAGNTWGDAFYVKIYKSLTETTQQTICQH